MSHADWFDLEASVQFDSFTVPLPALLEAKRNGRNAVQLGDGTFGLLPIDWLDGAWFCPDCRDTGFVEGRMCHCLHVLYEKHRRQSLSALLKLGSESFETFDLSYYSDESSGGLSPRAQMALVLGFCRDYAAHFGKSSVNLLFRGGTHPEGSRRRL